MKKRRNLDGRGPMMGKMRLTPALGVLILAACGSSTNEPPPIAPAAPVAPTATIAAEPPAPVPPPATDAGAPVSTGPFAGLPPSLPLDVASTTPPAVKRTGKTWPFHAWDRAEVVVFNWTPMGPGHRLRAYDEHGWTTDLAHRASLDLALAKRGVDVVVKKQEGELLVSKCAFPRHAVILFEGDVPIASINVCFSCHDVLLWPQLPPAPMAEKRAATALVDWEDIFVTQQKLPLWPKGQP